ncbi:MAG: beta-ketoacyl-[acyl-carrier-protein] synthase family protein, partial [Phycisphaerales bacterium]|nr:beta-ketoacyl-[acyl-carrier-protein] synthase family protein [Phycisphaerales bacterium]
HQPTDPAVQSTVAATCPDFNPDAVMSVADQKRLPRLLPMAMAAATEALLQADLPADGSEATGVILGTGAGGIDFTLDQAAAYHAPDPGRHPSLWTITNATHGNLAGELSIRLDLRGPSLCISTGCASSSDAIGLAMDLLRSRRPGAPRRLVVVGADAHVRDETLLGMELLRVISTRRCTSADEASRASRPFDAGRDGFILGEGAWALVLERADEASVRGTRILAALRGYGATCDAYHRVRPVEDMEGSVRAMQHALQDAELEPTDIEVFHYHGTATETNDRLETLAVRRAFGDHARSLRGTSVKSMIGHPQGACGAAAMVATIGALAGLDGDTPFIPPTINLDDPDRACDLEYTPNVAVPTTARTALVNCLAFGAKNSALVLTCG